MKALKSVLSLLVCCVALTACKHVEEGRFLADVHINDKPAKLAYDTGSESTLIFSKTVRRVGLKEARHPSGSPPPGKVMLGQTDFCRVKLRDDSYSLKLSTLHLPWWWGFDVDGVIGWPDMADDLIEIDAANAMMTGLKELPAETRRWLKLPLYTHTGVLALEIPREDGKIGIVEIDTGNSAGVSLAPERWEQWKTAHPKARKGWTFSIMPGTGATFGRRYSADDLNLGPLMLNHVPVRKANRTEIGIANGGGIFEGSIGFRALERMNLIVDRKNQVAYVNCKLALPPTNQVSHKKPAQKLVAATNSQLKLNLRNHEYFDHAMEAFDGLRFEEAITNCERLLELEPKNLLMLACEGESKYHLGASRGNETNIDRAIEQMNHVLEQNPRISRAYIVRGNSLYLQHKWDLALLDYRQFCELNSADASYPQFFIWMIRTQSSEQTAADSDLGTFLKENKSVQKSPWETDIGNFLLGRMSETNFLNAANVRDVNHPNGTQCEAWFYAGFKRRLAGDPPAAREYFQKCVATGMKEFDEYGFAVAELKRLD